MPLVVRWCARHAGTLGRLVCRVVQAAKPDCLIESNAGILRPVVGFVKCFLGQSLPMAQIGVFRRFAVWVVCHIMRGHKWRFGRVWAQWRGMVAVWVLRRRFVVFRQPEKCA